MAQDDGVSIGQRHILCSRIYPQICWTMCVLGLPVHAMTNSRTTARCVLATDDEPQKKEVRVGTFQYRLERVFFLSKPWDLYSCVWPCIANTLTNRRLHNYHSTRTTHPRRFKGVQTRGVAVNDA